MALRLRHSTSSSVGPAETAANDPESDEGERKRELEGCKEVTPGRQRPVKSRPTSHRRNRIDVAAVAMRTSVVQRLTHIATLSLQPKPLPHNDQKWRALHDGG